MDQYIVSARKYRPATFESVVGQKSLTDTLRNAIRQNHLAHAYLFCGPRGVGKTTCARIFAKTINCLNPTPEHDACNECESCRAFNEQRSFNIHELDAASNNSVEDIRTLIQEVRIPPQIGKYSVYIIDEVHMLSQGAFNALLKTLEEPPSYAVFILATTEKHKVLPTILSRCQVYDFQRITVRDIIEYLQYVAQQEGIETEEQALSVVAEKADGGMRDALSVFDQLVAFCGKKITYQQTIQVLNVLDTEYYFRMNNAALDSKVTDALLLLDEILQKGFDAGNFITGWTAHLRDVLVAKDDASLKLLETSDAIRATFQQEAKKCSAQWIFQALDILNTCDINYRLAKNKRLTVELAIVKICRIAMAYQPSQIQQISQPSVVAANGPVNKSSSVSEQTSKAQTVTQPIVMTPKPQPSQAQPMQMGKLPSLNLQRQSTQTQPTAKNIPAPVEEVQQTPFTADRLLQIWAGLDVKFPKEERLLSMLRSYLPVIVSPTELELTLTNPWQKEEFSRFGTEIINEMRRQSGQAKLQLRVIVAEHASHKQAYTAEEKFKVMVDTNSELAHLKQALALQLE